MDVMEKQFKRMVLAYLHLFNRNLAGAMTQVAELCEIIKYQQLKLFINQEDNYAH